MEGAVKVSNMKRHGLDLKQSPRCRVVNVVVVKSCKGDAAMQLLVAWEANSSCAGVILSGPASVELKLQVWSCQHHSGLVTVMLNLVLFVAYVDAGKEDVHQRHSVPPERSTQMMGSC